MSDEVWPVLFIAWHSKIEEVVQKLQNGQLIAKMQSKLHARKDARFLLVSESGRVLALGTLDQVSGDNYGLFLLSPIPNPETVLNLPNEWFEPLKDFSSNRLKFPVTVWAIPPDTSLKINKKWFNEVYDLTETHYNKSKGENQTFVANDDAATVANKEHILSQWLPPILNGLLADRIRADQWEIMVGNAFRALGCHVKMFGHQVSGRAEPDCIATYTSPSGQIVEILIDAKSGTWHGSIEDIRAMRDYHAMANPYTFPLFVANSLGKDVPSKLHANPMRGKIPKAITGHDLALLIFQRLTKPDFDIELELRGLLL